MDLFNILDCENYITGLSEIANIIKIVNTAYTILLIVVPILLIIWGIMDLMKGVIASKEDEIKKGQQTLIKRVIAAVIVFFVLILVKFIVTIVAGDDKTSVIDCVNCFINGNSCGTTVILE